MLVEVGVVSSGRGSCCLEHGGAQGLGLVTLSICTATTVFLVSHLSLSPFPLPSGPKATQAVLARRLAIYFEVGRRRGADSAPGVVVSDI